MSRPKRTWRPDGIYHIVMRGNNRQAIFQHPKDVNAYFRILSYAFEKYHFEIYAYCFMSNHVHFLLNSPEVPLGDLMALTNKRYSDFYRREYDYTGQIYENRYFSDEIADPPGLLYVSGYIHRNPIETTKPIVQVMEHYPHSSYQYYFYDKDSPHPFINLQFLPSILSAYSLASHHSTHPNKSKAYALYCSELNIQEKRYQSIEE
ncbi:transposase [Pseudogracilibacillus auburnensis]|uniref:transposase n=1 Tax=Pseudogracilibacillus auburnensis TaxID=1494959 RepID=UPI001A964FE3|nr:transposase [Pseudogracilibacillus auburnensis]MBO1005900.1 transposase [Pseudogracilibacillus auburnensis]